MSNDNFWKACYFGAVTGLILGIILCVVATVVQW